MNASASYPGHRGAVVVRPLRVKLKVSPPHRYDCGGGYGCVCGYGGVCGYDYMMMAGPGTRLASGRRAPGVPSTVHMAPERARPPQTPKHDRGHRCSGGSRGSTRQGQERPSFLRLHGLSAAGARRIPVIVSARISTSGRTSSGRYFRRLG